LAKSVVPSNAENGFVLQTVITALSNYHLFFAQFNSFLYEFINKFIDTHEQLVEASIIYLSKLIDICVHIIKTKKI
jgi:hypothetical protein